MAQSYCQENYWMAHCSDGKLTGWVGHNSILSIGVDVIIGLAALALVWWFLWWLFSYRERPFCVFCLQEGNETRTTNVYKGQPACWEHLMEHLMADEPKYECPKHHLPMEKQHDEDGIITDYCPQGCTFNDEQELDEMIENAREDAHASGMAAGTGVGIAIGSSINSGN